MVEIRSLELADIPMLIKYWYHSPPGFIESIGVDPTKLGSPVEFEAFMRGRLELPDEKRAGVAILYNGEPVGQHSINPLVEGDHGIFHAHIWNSAHRGKGIGLQSYVLASHLFMNRFNLKRIVYKTPKQNTASIRVKEKLGMRFIGEEEIGHGLVKAGTIAKVFEVTRDELAEMFANRVKFPGYCTH
ncbi:MAG: GNAT family N-acetyltransferase [Bdellovibrionales bacterium]